jgi:hypothetical protein
VDLDSTPHYAMMMMVVVVVVMMMMMMMMMSIREILLLMGIPMVKDWTPLICEIQNVSVKFVMFVCTAHSVTHMEL